MPRGKALPKVAIQPVKDLFPTDPLEPSPEQIAFYRQVQQEHGAFYFGVDRQSDDKELRREGHTGMNRRIEAILAAAPIAKAWAPIPTPVEHRRQGDLPYTFDPRFWFLDGKDKRATGHAVNINARPEFWRAYLLGLGLARHGCAPAAFITGETTRLFRDTTWLHTFCKSLWNYRIRIIVGNFGEVTESTMVGLQAMIQALSHWLPDAARGARAARRKNHQLAHSHEPFGVLFETDPTSPNFRRVVYAHPQEWPILCEMIRRADAGEFPNLHAFTEWLLASYGIARSYGWVRRLLFVDTHLDGYYHSDKTQHSARILEHAPLRDLDITESGRRRYLVTPKSDPLIFPVDFAYYNQSPRPSVRPERTYSALPYQQCLPIDPDQLARVRAMISGRRRPPTGERRRQCCLSGHAVRCAVCGYSVRENPPTPQRPHWSLYCQCVETIRMRRQERDEHGRPLSRQKIVNQRSECQHTRYATLPTSLSEIVWERLRTGIESCPPDLEGESVPDEVTEEQRLQGQLETLNHQLAQLVTWMMHTPLTEKTKVQVEQQQAELSTAITACEGQLNTLSSAMIHRRMQSAALRHAQRMLRACHEAAGPELRRELVGLMVQRVVVHLQEGWYQIEVRGNSALFDALRGSLTELQREEHLEMLSERTDAFHFQVILTGTLVA